MSRRSNRCCRAAQLPLLLSSVPVLSVVFFSSDVHTCWSLKSKPWWWSWGLGARWAYSCFCNAATIMAQLDTAFLVAPLIFFADMIADTSLTDGSGHCGTTTPALEPHLSLVQASWNVQLLQSLIIRRLWLIPQLLSAVRGLQGCVGGSSKTELIYPYLFLLCWSTGSMGTSVAFCLHFVYPLHPVVCIRLSWTRRRGWRWGSGFSLEFWPVRRPTPTSWRPCWSYVWFKSLLSVWTTVSVCVLAPLWKKTTDSECV